MDSVLTPDRDRLEQSVADAMSVASCKVMEWGDDDCALWVANILRDGGIGYDPAEDFRGRYRTKRGAHRKLGRGGLVATLRKAANKHGWVRINPDYAQVGDLGLIRGPDGVASTVICRGGGWFVGRNDRGFTAFASKYVQLAWNVVPETETQPQGHRVSFGEHKIGMRSLPAPVHEPVSLAIGLTALIQGFGVSFATASLIGGIIVGGAISVGISALASLLQPKVGLPQSGTAGQSSVQEQVQITERQPTPSKRVIFGAAYVGGALFFEQVKPPFLYLGLLLNHGEIAGVDTIWIGTNKLTFSRIIFNSILTPLVITGTPNYNARLQCSLRAGTTSQARDAILLNDFTPLNANFTQNGIATAVFRYHFGADQTEFTALWGQVQRPNSYLLVRGVKVYDPRDPTQDLNDETTWKWSDNASLIQAYYLTRDYGGKIPKSKIVWDKVADSADYDDEVIVCADGTRIKRHTINGVVTLNQKPVDVMLQLLTANAGMIVQSGGKYWVTSSKPKTAIATIYDAILQGSIEIRGGQPKKDMINNLQTRFVASEQNYQTVDLPVLRRDDLITTDGEVLTATLELPFTTDYRRAERLQKQFIERSRLGRQVTCTVDIAFLADLDEEPPGSAFNVSSDLFPSGNGIFVCTSFAFADDLASAALTLTEYDPSIESDWNGAVDERPFVAANPFTL